jgi:hypothetical protein
MTMKQLFAHSGDLCAFPDCTVRLIHGKTCVGEICHIKATNPTGPRYDPQQTDADRHSYSNLILLCANHHTIVDDDPETYTVECLSKMKADHAAHSAKITTERINKGAQLLADQSVTTSNQSGGIAAHTVNQTISYQRTYRRLPARLRTPVYHHSRVRVS